MNRLTQFFGIFGLVVLIFGLLTFFLMQGEGGIFTVSHIAAGLALITVFLLRGGLQLISGAALKRTAGYSAGVTVYSSLFAGILIVANLYFYENDPLRIDTTEQNVYTLAPQTHKALAVLEESVIIRGFFIGGEVTPEVEDLLKRLQKASKNIEFRAIDPEKDPAATQRFGVSEKDTLHLSFAREDSSREVKVVRDLSEQNIVNGILKLTRGGSKKIYWIYGHGEANLDDDTEAGYLFLKEAIQGENIAVEQLLLAGAVKLPDDADAILLMAPRKSLLENEKALLKSYLEDGGSMLLLSEPNTVPDVAELVSPLGIAVGQDIVLDQVVRLFAGPGVGVQPVVQTYSDHPAVEGFDQNTIFSTISSVRVSDTDKEGVVLEEIAFTGDNSWVDTDVANIFSEKPEVKLPPEDKRSPVPVAAAFSRKMKDDSEKESRVIVIGDADFIANVNIRHLFNRDFMLNALNWVIGEQQRVSIRARTLKASTKTITPEQFRSIFLVCALLLPEVVLIWGLSIWWLRKG